MEIRPSVRNLRPAVETIMEDAARIDLSRQASHWYPLALATYGSDEVLEALESMCSFRTSMWEKTRRFEEAFGMKYGGEAVMVNSGSSADLLIAFAMHEMSGGPLRSGDEILVPAVTWPTQLWSLLMAGFTTRLIDVDPVTMNVDLSNLEAKIGPKTKAISLVHLMGNPVDMDVVSAICRRHDLILLEDCCESLGAQWRSQYVGTYGEASAFSFFFSHHITTMEGGMILTQKPELAERFRLLRAHGWSRNLRNPPGSTDGLDPRYTFLNWGFNVRPTELQAGFGLVQLEKSERFQEARDLNARVAAERLFAHAPFLRLMQVSSEGRCTWFALPILVSPDAPFSRDDLTHHLESQGVETRPVVTGNLARHPAAERFRGVVEMGSLPGADYVHENGFYIGLHPVDARSDLERVFDIIDEFVVSRS